LPHTASSYKKLTLAYPHTFITETAEHGNQGRKEKLQRETAIFGLGAHRIHTSTYEPIAPRRAVSRNGACTGIHDAEEAKGHEQALDTMVTAIAHSA
jgi:hypothetical protein